MTKMTADAFVQGFLKMGETMTAPEAVLEWTKGEALSPAMLAKIEAGFQPYIADGDAKGKKGRETWVQQRMALLKSAPNLRAIIDVAEALYPKKPDDDKSKLVLRKGSKSSVIIKGALAYAAQQNDWAEKMRAAAKDIEVSEAKDRRVSKIRETMEALLKEAATLDVDPVLTSKMIGMLSDVVRTPRAAQ